MNPLNGNGANSRARDAVYISHFLLCLALTKQIANSTHNSGWHAMPLSLHHVVAVLSVRSDAKMCRVAAPDGERTVIACMKYELVALQCHSMN